jgi:GT2 family glycosyltransferase
VPSLSLPALSVVVGLISGRREDLERCLRALHDQTLTLDMEVLVPYDPPCADVAALAEQLPSREGLTVRFLPVDIDTAAARRGASREHHDTLRTVGLRAARGQLIALTEDHAHTAPSWCEELVAALERFPDAAAVGGAVECDSERRLNWAVYFCDFGRYQNPLPPGPSEFVSDSNVVYRREALERVAAAWKDDYHETAVHWAMIAAGYRLCTTPRVVVWQRRHPLGLAEALNERYVWARSFAGTRGRLEGVPKRVVRALLAPLLPLVMTARVARQSLERGAHTGRFLAALPLVLLLQVFWALGELVGYVTGRADAAEAGGAPGGEPTAG